ncbi:PREDICTED: uncharacterized protein LOC109585946 [Amphimedon queenslandica]|uniref:PH domain-containing protein n=2 Tax=Amphimedon queenslandica TaxID=400682 RepID=A0AAN0JLM0_AMPQE|nr:PREDICTED: uncharacterized protein LOC109585946 [Amphimedon queenslandica]|eukprot:XP_019857656.1 PREDICTED: uncharacterized protein LOC109585946 [Amphimedon queenslandica]
MYKGKKWKTYFFKVTGSTYLHYFGESKASEPKDQIFLTAVSAVEQLRSLQKLLKMATLYSKSVTLARAHLGSSVLIVRRRDVTGWRPLNKTAPQCYTTHRSRTSIKETKPF